MNVVSQEAVAADFARYVKATKKGPVVVTHQGKPVAVLLRSESDDDIERLLMGHSPQLQSILQAARKRFREGRGIPHDAFWKEIDAENPTGKKRGRSGKNGRSSR